MNYNKGTYVITSDGDIWVIDGSLYTSDGYIYLVNLYGDKKIMRKNSISREIVLNREIINLEEIIWLK